MRILGNDFAIEIKNSQFYDIGQGLMTVSGFSIMIEIAHIFPNP